jgi:membrane protease subunit HflC
MSRRLLIVLGVVLVAAGIVLHGALFIVDQTETALVLQFGQPRRVILEPGLQFKRPFVEDVVIYDKRVLDFEPPHEEVIVSDQKRVVVDDYSRYRIVDPLLFYQTVGSEAGVRARLSAIVSGSLRRVLGNVTLSDILSGKRAQIMVQIRDEVGAQAKEFGVEVVDVRLRRADLPEENSQAIYARMVSERQQQASQYRGEGA